MRLLCLGVLGFVLAAAPLAYAAEPMEAPDLEAKIAAGDYRVYCADVIGVRDAWGVAAIDYNLMFLDNSLCAALRGPLVVNDQYALALLAVTHEMSHLWWRNPVEGQTECFALYLYRWEARHRFGATAAQAQQLYALAWLQHQRLSPEYTTGCARLTRDPLPD